MKEEALKLADEQAEIGECYTALIIRRLVEELDKQIEPVAWMRRQDGRIIRLTPERIRETDEPLYTTPQTKPLSDEEINEISMKCYVYPADGSMIFNQHKFARAIEKRHGIK